jgi:GTP-binding protein EngB required for normal cell division
MTQFGDTADITAAKLKELVAQTLLLLKESQEYQKSPEIGMVFSEACQTLTSLHRRLQSAEKRYSVGVVGLTNVGKSTLLNAIFGCELAPRRNGPCTSAPIEFTHGPELRVEAWFRHSLKKSAWSCGNVEAVHERLSAMADDSGAEQNRLVRKVVVEVPLPILYGGLVISDTPGFGAAQTDDAAGSHETALKEYLRTEISQVFWVVLGEQGIGKREKEFHNSFFGEICDDVIVTGCDDWEESDKSNFRKRFSAIFSQRLPRFHFVSGKRGNIAKQQNNRDELERAGIPALEERIKSLADAGGRFQAIIEGYRQLGRDMRDWHGENAEDATGGIASLWRPDSWIRWRSFVAKAKLGKLAEPFGTYDRMS